MDLADLHLVDQNSDQHAAAECHAFLRSVPILFQIDDATLWDIARKAQTREFAPGTRILAQGDHEGPDDDRRFYVIRSGSADVLRTDPLGRERAIARLSLGSYFGELGLLTNQARNATVRVRGSMPLRAYSFDALTFHRRIAEHVLQFRLLRDRQTAAPEAATAHASRRHGSQRTPMPGSFTAGATSDPSQPAAVTIEGSQLLSGLRDADLQFVMRSAEERWHPANATIVNQGDPGDRFYVLLEGSVEVERDGASVARLGAGDFFGETALLLDTPRTATVRADTHALTWSVTRAAFQRLVGGHLLANPRTQEEIIRRVRQSLPAGAGAGGAPFDSPGDDDVPRQKLTP